MQTTNHAMRRRRIALGLSQRAVAERAGVGLVIVGLVERRSQTVLRQTAESIGRALGLSPEEVSPNGFRPGKMGPQKKRSAIYNRTIFERRKELGLTIREISEQSGVGPLTVNKIENGHQGRQNSESASRVLRVLGLDPQVIPDTVSGVHPSRRPNEQEIWEEDLFRNALPVERAAGVVVYQDPSRDIERQEAVSAVRAELSRLRFRERAILELEYGLGSFPAMSLRAASRILGMSPQRCYQIKFRAINRLTGRAGPGRLLRQLLGVSSDDL